MTAFVPDELVLMEREEQEARSRLAEHRERQRLNEGEAPTEDEELLQRLEAEWRHALARLERLRESRKG
jgi:hypothetical protein